MLFLTAGEPRGGWHEKRWFDGGGGAGFLVLFPLALPFSIFFFKSVHLGMVQTFSSFLTPPDLPPCTSHLPPCPLEPGAQLHFLIVCTGESRQWLPPQGPRKTSGHIVCKWQKKEFSKMGRQGSQFEGACDTDPRVRGLLNLIRRFLLCSFPT